MQKTLLALLPATAATAGQAEVCLNRGCIDMAEEKQIAAKLTAVVEQHQAMLPTEQQQHKFQAAQQLWAQFVEQDCRYNTTAIRSPAQHDCTMQHYHQRLEELKQRSNRLENNR